MAKDRIFDVLPEILFGSRPKVLLVGNGINLSFPGALNTDEIIKNEWEKHYGTILPDRSDEKNPHEIWKLPFPMQVVAASKDHVQSSMTKLADTFRKTFVDDSQVSFIKDILDSDFDVILSTNYSLEIEQSVFNKFSPQKVYKKYKVTRKQTSQQQQFGIFQCTELPYRNNPLLWHIHGTALRKDSMVIGQLYYGKLLSEVTSRASVVASNYISTNTAEKAFQPLSWVDYFLIGDVYVFGFRLDYSEIDIWWLLSYKKSLFPESKLFFYAPEIPSEKKLLLDSYDVITPTIAFDEDGGDNRFIEYYKNICFTLH